ncbi:hypothetical protein, partial [Alistipes finegoldii]|uniref:hypothetical protein n=1 Tax=Alistipes finegoldii TaxID=214856 RepID=UPI0025A476CF
ARAGRNSGWRFGYIFVPKRSGRFWMIRGYITDFQLIVVLSVRRSPAGNNCLTHNILIFGRVLPDICYRTVPVAGRGLREK